MIDRGDGVEYRVLRADHPQIVIARLAPGAKFEDLRAHQGEDYWVVQKGTVSLEYGGKEYEIREGQTVRFSGTLPHGFANTGNTPAELFALCSFPYW
jgi:mannose-6-phosphate isomerase-like protein (cupin superfamily)